MSGLIFENKSSYYVTQFFLIKLLKNHPDHLNLENTKRYVIDYFSETFVFLSNYFFHI